MSAKMYVLGWMIFALFLFFSTPKNELKSRIKEISFTSMFVTQQYYATYFTAMLVGLLLVLKLFNIDINNGVTPSKIQHLFVLFFSFGASSFGLFQLNEWINKNEKNQKN